MILYVFTFILSYFYPQAESLFDDDDEKSAPKIATSVILKSPQHITFSQTAKMFIVESDGKLVNRIRVVDTDGTISHYAGMMKSPCDCTLPDCVCYNKKVRNLRPSYLKQEITEIPYCVRWCVV